MCLALTLTSVIRTPPIDDEYDLSEHILDASDASSLSTLLLS